jgi:hypothetical protein
MKKCLDKIVIFKIILMKEGKLFWHPISQSL